MRKTTEKKGKLISIMAAFMLAVAFYMMGGLTAKAAAQTTTGIPADKRVVFIGDSRTVDMFSSVKSRINGSFHDNMYVYAKDGGTYTYMVNILNKIHLQKGDILVSWMGCNDHGNFNNYRKCYNKLRKQGITLIVCTLGYSDDSRLVDEGDHLYYNNLTIQGFNRDLVSWAKKKGVKTIDLYKYTVKYIAADEESGIHYNPKPTKRLWKYVVRKVGQLITKMTAEGII